MEAQVIKESQNGNIEKVKQILEFDGTIINCKSI